MSSFLTIANNVNLYCWLDVGEMDLNSIFDNDMIEDDVIPALEMAMWVTSDNNYVYSVIYNLRREKNHKVK